MKYEITFPFRGMNGYNNEISIKSYNLIYSEIGSNHSGVQVTNLKNEEEIHKKCRHVADLIREIDKLNE